MFGLLRIKSCGLPEDDRLSYKATFCSACHAMHQFGGWWSSLATNYDITLWLALAQALDRQERAQVRKPCTAVPIQKVTVYELDTKVAATAAALNLALVGAKIRDNRDDGSALWGVADSAFSKKREKAERYLSEGGFPVGVIQELAAQQSQAEAAPNPTLDSLAKATRVMMGETFAHLSGLLELPELRDDLSRLGVAVGGFVYLWDAALDQKQDLRKGSFNALAATDTGDSVARDRLRHELNLIEQGLDRLPLLRQQAIFTGLLKSLRSKVAKQFPQTSVGGPRRMEASQAAFVKAQDCDCCEFGCSGCCEVDMCPCGKDGCGVKCCKCCDCCDVCCCCK